MDTQVLLDWQRVYAWAEAQQPGSVLGESCAAGWCPIARYLNQQTSHPGAWLVGSSIKREGSREHLDKPDWVRAAIKRVDRLHGYVGGTWRHPITREQFLEILDQVKP